MEEKKFKSLKQKGQNRVYGKDWLFSGQSKGFPNTLDIRYKKDLKLQESSRKKSKEKKGGKSSISGILRATHVMESKGVLVPKTLLRKPKILD